MKEVLFDETLLKGDWCNAYSFNSKSIMKEASYLHDQKDNPPFAEKTAI